MNTPGKYDELCTYVREAAGAEGVILLVLAGARGYGMSVQGSAGVHARLPRLLRDLAQALEDETRRLAS